MVSSVSARHLTLILIGLVAVFLAATGIGWWAASRPPVLPTAPVPAGGYPTLLARAADDLAARLAPTGPGVSFEMTQRQIYVRREGAPPILYVPAPSATPTPTDSLYFAGYMGRGFIHGGVFLDEIRGGLEANDAFNFDLGTPTYTVMVNPDGAVWRDNGHGWFETGRSGIPGQGIDPFSLSRLPQLLRNLSEITDGGEETIDGQPVHRYSGQGKSTDWPGIVVPDGLAFTASPLAIDVWVSSDGRLVRLHGETFNLNETEHQLLIVDEVDFGTDVSDVLPSPSPLYVRPTPEPDISPEPSPSSSAIPSTSVAPSTSPTP